MDSQLPAHPTETETAETTDTTRIDGRVTSIWNRLRGDRDVEWNVVKRIQEHGWFPIRWGLYFSDLTADSDSSLCTSLLPIPGEEKRRRNTTDH